MLIANAARVVDQTTFRYEAAHLLPWKDALADDLRSNGVPVQLFETRSEFDLRWAWSLRSRLWSDPVDIIHVHSAYVAAIARIVVHSLPRRVRPKLLTTEHNTWPGYPTLTRIANTATFWMDDAHLAVSTAVRRSVPAVFRPWVHPLNHGIPFARVREAAAHRESARAELGVSPDEILIGTIGHLVKQKGYPYLLRAARRVLDAGARARFVAVGGGPQEDLVRNLHAELGLGDRFLLLGVRSDACRILAGCDVFTLASLWEGLPLVVMEALTLGVAVVATEVGGLPELVTDGVDGVLVPPANDERLAEALLSMISDSARRARLGSAGARSAWRFDNAHAVHVIEDFYRELAGSRRRRAPRDGAAQNGTRDD